MRNWKSFEVNRFILITIASNNCTVNVGGEDSIIMKAYWVINFGQDAMVTRVDYIGPRGITVMVL